MSFYVCASINMSKRDDDRVVWSEHLLTPVQGQVFPDSPFCQQLPFIRLAPCWVPNTCSSSRADCPSELTLAYGGLRKYCNSTHLVTACLKWWTFYLCSTGLTGSYKEKENGVSDHHFGLPCRACCSHRTPLSVYMNWHNLTDFWGIMAAYFSWGSGLLLRCLNCKSIHGLAKESLFISFLLQFHPKEVNVIILSEE